MSSVGGYLVGLGGQRFIAIFFGEVLNLAEEYLSAGCPTCTRTALGNSEYVRASIDISKAYCRTWDMNMLNISGGMWW